MFDNAIDKFTSAADFLIGKFSDVFSIGDDILSGGFTAILENIGDVISYALRFIFDLLFVDLFDTCEVYGYKVLNSLFNTFSNNNFDFSAIEYVVGFIFLVYVIKLTISIVRG